MSREGHFLVAAGTSGYLGDLKKSNFLISLGIEDEPDGNPLAWLPGSQRL